MALARGKKSAYHINTYLVSKYKYNGLSARHLGIWLGRFCKLAKRVRLAKNALRRPSRIQFKTLGACAPIRGVAQPGRVLRSGRRSRRFESSHPDQQAIVARISAGAVLDDSGRKIAGILQMRRKTGEEARMSYETNT